MAERGQFRLDRLDGLERIELGGGLGVEAGGEVVVTQVVGEADPHHAASPVDGAGSGSW